MVNIVKVALILVSVLASAVLARNGCRQCSGEQTFILDQAVNVAQAKDYLSRKLAGCATGGDYFVKSVSSMDCDGALCRIWKFGLDVFRYCGNGSKVSRTRDQKCTASGCYFADYLDLDCTRSVTCSDRCDCTECGC